MTEEEIRKDERSKTIYEIVKWMNENLAHCFRELISDKLDEYNEKGSIS